MKNIKWYQFSKILRIYKFIINNVSQISYSCIAFHVNENDIIIFDGIECIIKGNKIVPFTNDADILNEFHKKYK